MRYYQWKRNRNENIQIGKVICLARTYKKHAREMNTDIPISPVIFLKPSSAIIFSEESIIYPSQSTCLHHEIEFGVVIGRNGRHVLVSNALDYVEGYCIGLDITARDIQQDAKKKGLPWTIAKGFDTFAPISDIVDKEDVYDPHQVSFQLSVNNEVRQKDNTKNLIWNIPELISYISSIMTLECGDLILTGTPSGVGEISRGDDIVAEAENYCRLHVSVK